MWFCFLPRLSTLPVALLARPGSNRFIATVVSGRMGLAGWSCAPTLPSAPVVQEPPDAQIIPSRLGPCRVGFSGARPTARFSQRRGARAAPVEGVSAADNPELWVYLHEMRRYDDPKSILRRKAEERSAHRRRRLESQKWYGYSPLRPMATSIPQMGEPAPMWIGNGYHPYHWVSSPWHVYVIYH